MTIFIRKAIIEDCKTIHKFIHELGNEGEFSEWYTGDLEGVKKEFFGDDKIAYAFIAEKNDKPIGMAVYTYIFFGPTSSRMMYLHYLYVTPEERNNGVGNKFIRHLKSSAIDKGIKRIRLLCEYSNEKARKFYKDIDAEEWPEVLTIDMPL